MIWFCIGTNMTIGATLLSVGILFSLHLCSHMQLASYPGFFSPTPVGENVPVVHAASNLIAHNVKIVHYFNAQMVEEPHSSNSIMCGVLELGNTEAK